MALPGAPDQLVHGGGPGGPGIGKVHDHPGDRVQDPGESDQGMQGGLGVHGERSGDDQAHVPAVRIDHRDHGELR